MTVTVPEDFTPQEANVLRAFFTNADGSVYGFRGQPPAVAASLMSFSAHSPRSVRRLFLDIFAADLVATQGAVTALGRALDDGASGAFASVHLAADQVSRPVIDVLSETAGLSLAWQGPALPYDLRHRGRYRYVRPREVMNSRFGARFVGDLDRIFDAYAQVLTAVGDHLRRTVGRRHDQSDFEYRRRHRATAQQAAGRLLPAAASGGVVLHGDGRTLGGLVERLRRRPLAEMHVLSELLLHELRTLLPGLPIGPVDGDDAETSPAPPRPDHSGPADRPPVSEAPGATAIVTATAQFIETRSRHRFEVVTDDAVLDWFRDRRGVTVTAGRRIVDAGYVRPTLIDEAGLGEIYDQTMARSAQLATDLGEDFDMPVTYAVAAGFRRAALVEIDDMALGALLAAVADDAPDEAADLVAAIAAQGPAR